MNLQMLGKIVDYFQTENIWFSLLLFIKAWIEILVGMYVITYNEELSFINVNFPDIVDASFILLIVVVTAAVVDGILNVTIYLGKLVLNNGYYFNNKEERIWALLLLCILVICDVFLLIFSYKMLTILIIRDLSLELQGVLAILLVLLFQFNSNTYQREK